MCQKVYNQTNLEYCFFSKTLNRSGTQKGDVQAIGYRLAYLDAISPEDDESAFKTFNLYRIVNSPSRTLDMLNKQGSHR